MHRERLCAMLWPDDFARVAMGRLRNVLSRIRARTGGLVARDIDPVTFAAPVWVDATEFMCRSAEAIRQSSIEPAAALREGGAALALHLGYLLPCDRYADWALESSGAGSGSSRQVAGVLADAADVVGVVHLAKLYREQAAYAHTDAPPGW